MKLSIKENNLIIHIASPCESNALLEKLHLSRKSRYLLYSEQRITCNGQPLKHNASLKQGDVLTLQPPQPQESVLPWAHPIQVQYEDELLLVVNKEAGMLVHSDGRNTEHTLCNCVASYYQQTHQQIPVRPLHRLDVETSGILLFCKAPLLQPLLDHLMESKQISRSYLAIVHGRFPSKPQIYRDPIGRDRHDARRYLPYALGKPAMTKASLVAYDPGLQRSLIRCTLFSGRTHQIRVHLSAHGYPLLNDPLYGRSRCTQGRLALHSATLSLIHPLTQQRLSLECPLPADLKKLLTNNNKAS